MEPSTWLLEPLTEPSPQPKRQRSENDTVVIECRLGETVLISRAHFKVEDTKETRLRKYTAPQVRLFLKVLRNVSPRRLEGEDFKIVLACAKKTGRFELEKKLLFCSILNDFLLLDTIDDQAINQCREDLAANAFSKAADNVYSSVYRFLNLWLTDLPKGLALIDPANHTGCWPTHTLYALGCIRAGNPDAGIKWVEEASKNFYGPAYIVYGRYLLGTGQQTKALNCFRDAANRDLVLGQRLAADCYAQGVGTEANWKKAEPLYACAANAGDLPSMYALGRHFYAVEQYDAAANWWELAAAGGEVRSQFNLALLYHQGKGVDANPKLSFLWALKAAKQGNITAQRNVGILYFTGTGCQKDYAKAFQWLAPLAEGGNATAQYYLGRCYLNGRGVKKNRAKAVKFLNLAAKNGHTKASKLLKKIAE